MDLGSLTQKIGAQPCCFGGGGASVLQHRRQWFFGSELINKRTHAWCSADGSADKRITGSADQPLAAKAAITGSAVGSPIKTGNAR